MPKVFVSGCYDMLHSGHVAFFEEAAAFGDLYVGIGSDRTIIDLKGRRPVNTEAERLYMVRALRCVKEAWINRGSGLMDFEEEVRALRPDIFFVNTDGYTPLKERFCRELGIELRVGERRPHPGLPVRSTTALRQECTIPYRIELCGGWLDQPFVSAMAPGAVLTISIEPDQEYNDRSGLATSSRRKAVELWNHAIPGGDRRELARMLFCMENPPGTTRISGSQDQLGILLPGLNRLHYNGDYWPDDIKSVLDDSVLRFIEEHLWLLAMPQRGQSYDAQLNRRDDPMAAKKLAAASEEAWQAILAGDVSAWGRATTDSYLQELALFPAMATAEVQETIQGILATGVAGCKMTGCGGGGYLLIISEEKVPGAQHIRICRS